MSSRWRGCLLEIVETLVLTLVIFFVVQNFVAEPRRVEQESMMNTLLPGQNVLVDKLSPHVSDYKRGDIIVFWPPNKFSNDNFPFIKRVVGVGGDTVEVKDGAVWVNGVRLNEPYVFEGQPTEPLTGDSVWHVPDGYLFVLGDHRQQSQDSRYFGTIAKSSVIGRAMLRYWPLDVFGFIGSANYDGVPPGSLAPPSPSPSK